jgi:YaiO family outer membrane protein
MYKLFLNFLLIVSVSLSLNLPLYPQKFTDPEAEYSRIRSLAYDGKLPEAESAIIELLDSLPAYGDAWILLARIYGWQQKYEPAIAILDSIILIEPNNTDALEARRDLARWSNENQLAAEDSLTVIQPGIIPSTDLEKARKTDLRAGYYFDTFTEPYGRFWQVFQAGASRLLSFGRIIAGVNVGNLHSNADPAIKATEIQFEAEAYPKISQSDYAWLAYAYSPGKYFPAHRISAEYWHTFKYALVASAGMHYYYFDRNIFIGTLSLEKYYKSWWFSPRVYFYFKDIGVTTSLYLNARKYFNDINYLQLTVGFGTAPDEPFDIETDLERLSAYTVRLAYYTSITNNIFIRAGIGYSREEYPVEEYAESLQRNRFDGSINFIYILNNRK